MPIQERSRVQLFWAACLFAAIAAVGATTAFAAVKDFANARASGRWEQVQGVVLTSRPGTAKLRYAYFHQGASLEGARFAFLTRGRIGAPPSTAPGDVVTVYVAPDDPTMSVLVPGGSGRRFAIWFAAAGFVAFVGVGGLIRSMMAVDFPEYGGGAHRDDGTDDDMAPLDDHFTDRPGDADMPTPIMGYDDEDGSGARYETVSPRDGRAASTW